MAIPKASFHVRSTSLPTTSHPLDACIENHLRRLSASQAGPSSSSSISQNLCSIKNLYAQMDDMIHLPHNQQVLSCKGGFEEVLDGSLALLDISSSALEALSQMKESVLDLQSALRRGSVDVGVHAYLMSRKKICKIVSKCLANLKKAEKTCSLKKQENDAMTLTLLKEGEAISLSTLKSVLSYLMGKKATCGWSLVAKLVKSKHVPCEAENTSEVEEIDHVLCSLSEKQLGAETKVVLKQLKTLEMTIHELEDGLESVSRCFLKTRVSLLNVRNH